MLYVKRNVKWLPKITDIVEEVHNVEKAWWLSDNITFVCKAMNYVADWKEVVIVNSGSPQS
jgi:hypothetical protein